MEPGAGLGTVCRKSAQVEREPGGGPAAADVVVEVAVQRLEGAVEVRGQRDEQDPDVQLGQPEPPGQQIQPVAPLESQLSGAGS